MYIIFICLIISYGPTIKNADKQMWNDYPHNLIS